MTAAYPGSASPLSPLVDEQRLGSAGGQAAMGVAGIVLAVILVVGQISLATTKGIALHLHASVEHITEGNKVMESVIDRAAPTTELETLLESQATTLGHTRDEMVKTNRELVAVEKSTASLLDIVGAMQATSGQLATGVDGVDASTQRMTRLLGTLPDATTRTHKQLSTINRDTNAINGELGGIAGKMERYGLPHAEGAPTG